jgi:hypothetical protein
MLVLSENLYSYCRVRTERKLYYMVKMKRGNYSKYNRYQKCASYKSNKIYYWSKWKEKKLLKILVITKFITGQNEREETTQDAIVTKSAAFASYEINYLTYITATYTRAKRRWHEKFITGQNEREETTQDAIVTKSAAFASYETYITATHPRCRVQSPQCDRCVTWLSLKTNNKGI